MKKILSLIALFTLTMGVFAQVREDTLIHVPNVVAARPDQAIYFKENFDAETAAASYTLTENINEADYIIRLEVRPNLVIYDDGFEEPAPPEDPQFLLTLKLFQREGDIEMLAFEYPFTEVDEMYEFNLFLLYQAMANVPLTRFGGVELQDDLWRHKWIYIRTSLDLPFTIHRIDANDRSVYHSDRNTYPHPQLIHHVVDYVAGVTLGLELQYLHWMSSEFNLLVRFGDPTGSAFVPGIGLQVKFPIKPDRHFKLSPYIMGQMQRVTVPGYNVPPLAIGGGMQFGVRGGSMGALFADPNFLYTLGTVTTPVPPHLSGAGYNDPSTLRWTRWVISFGIGYKIGFIDRPPYESRAERRAREAAAANSNNYYSNNNYSNQPSYDLLYEYDDGD